MKFQYDQQIYKLLNWHIHEVGKGKWYGAFDCNKSMLMRWESFSNIIHSYNHFSVRQDYETVLQVCQ